MRKNWGNYAILLCTTACLTLSPLAVSAAAAAAETTAAETNTDAADVTAEETEEEAIEEAEDADVADDTALDAEEATETDDTDEADEGKSEASEKETKKEKKSTSKKKDKESYKEKILTITKDGFVADSFNGVDAIYRRGYGDGSNATYSCAAFIKKYYKTVYNVSLYNLWAGSTPKTYEGKKISSVKSPKVGDIAYKNSHWSIVKKVNDDGTVTLIEQNWKWNGNQCRINRTVKASTLTYYRLAK